MLIPLFLFIVFFTIIIVIIKAKTFDVDVKQQMDPAQVSSNKVRYIIYRLILTQKKTWKERTEEVKTHAATVRVDGYLAEIGGPRTSFSTVGDLPSKAEWHSKDR